jgi:hypothetical protein
MNALRTDTVTSSERDLLREPFVIGKTPYEYYPGKRRLRPETAFE